MPHTQQTGGSTGSPVETFETTIVQSIKEAATPNQLGLCAHLIKTTAIDFNHDEIADAFAAARLRVGGDTRRLNDVADVIMAKKARITRTSINSKAN